MANQKLLLRHASAIHGSDKRLPATTIHAFDIYEVFSYLSLRMPPSKDDPNPRIVKEIALTNANSLLNAGNAY